MLSAPRSGPPHPVHLIRMLASSLSKVVGSSLRRHCSHQVPLKTHTRTLVSPPIDEGHCGAQPKDPQRPDMIFSSEQVETDSGKNAKGRGQANSSPVICSEHFTRVTSHGPDQQQAIRSA